ncbi:MAG: biopolymer transporter ExbD [Gammaproteobacteria bacterium]|nr:MAG: biopolymer transporter ExbD [Gammaproteobacteria bacterium]
MRIDSPAPARHGISLTPLIDVVFILLIFFMLASSFARWQGVELELGRSQTLNTSKPELVLIQLQPGGLWRSDGQTLAPEVLIAQLQQRQQNENLAIALQAGAGSRVQELVDALAQLKEHGLNNLSLAKGSEQ